MSPRAAKEKNTPTRDRLRAIVDAWGGRRVLLIGDVAADVYLQGRTYRISREAPVLIVQQTGEFVVPGQAGNAAANLASLGANVTLVTIAGDDEMAERLRFALAERGVYCDWITANGRRTPTKTRVLAGSHHTRLQQIVRIDRDATEPPPPPAAREEFVDRIEAQLPDTEIVVVSDYGCNVLDAGIWSGLRRRTIEHELELVLDSRHRFGEFRDADFITPNEQEAMELTGCDPAAEPPEARSLAGECLARSGARAALLKRGNHGMCLAEEPGVGAKATARRFREFGVFGAAEAIDPSGAGDTVVATAALARVVGATWLEAAHLANVAAGLTTQKMGVASATPDEMRAALERWPQELRLPAAT